MAKKRQMDFQKTNLKVGRSIGKRANITATAFKAKKIIVHSKQPKPKSERLITDILMKIKNSKTSSAIKGGYLKELYDFINNQPETLRRNLCEILDSVLALALDSDEKVKTFCVNILIVTFEKTEDIHLHNYIARITGTIICLMKSTSNHSKLLSLSLLDSMLKHHSDTIVHCMPLLISIVNLVNFSPRKHCTYANSLLNASSARSGNIYSLNFQINLIGHMNAFLRELLKKMTEEQKEPEVLEGYFDGKGPVRWTNIPTGGFRQLWYNQGKSYITGLNLQNPYFDDSGLIEEFINGFISCLPLVYIEETASLMDNDDQLLPRETIKNLSILFETFSKVGEWAKLIPYTQSNTAIVKFLQERIFNPGRFPFCTAISIRGRTTQFLPCVQLNLAICHLCVEYLVLPGKANDIYNEMIFSYLKMVLGENEKVMPYEMKYESIPTILKIIKVYLNMTNDPGVSEFLNVCLDHLCSLIRVNDKHDNQKQLVSFLMQLSVDPAYYSFVEKSYGMKLFFKWLLKELKEKNSRLEKKYFKTIQRIACLKYPVYYQAVSSLNFSAMKDLLRNDNEDVRYTAIIMIYHMKEIDNSLLEDLTQFILEDRFPQSDAIRLILLLQCRFFDKDKIQEESSVYTSTGFVNFTLFLINLAIGICNMDEVNTNGLEDNLLGTALKTVSDSHTYNVIPSLRWEKHERLFDVCSKCLKLLPRESVNDILMTVVCRILDTTFLPMHCVIAMMKLDGERMIPSEPYRQKMYDLTFSCLMTLSILTQQDLDDKWYQWNINALQDSMQLTEDTALQILEIINNKKFDVPKYENENFVVYNFLRIFIFFHGKGLLNKDYAERILELQHFLKEICRDKRIIRQPLFFETYMMLSSYK